MAQALTHADTPIQAPAQFHPATAYTALVAAILSSPPDAIGPCADEVDIEVRYQHVDTIMSAIETYVSAITRDTASSLPLGTLDDGDVINILGDVRSDVVGAYQQAAHTMLRDLWSSSRRAA